jgi:hypothetical protein
MFRDLWIKYREWVFNPIGYPSVDRLIEVFDMLCSRITGNTTGCYHSTVTKVFNFCSQHSGRRSSVPRRPR